METSIDSAPQVKSMSYVYGHDAIRPFSGLSLDTAVRLVMLNWSDRIAWYIEHSDSTYTFEASDGSGLITYSPREVLRHAYENAQVTGLNG